MELSKHTAHRNAKYLSWLRKRPCVVSGEKAQCAHHIRLGTNGGCSLKPSDYFCVPLLHKYHTTGPDALHIIGEETFLRLFNLNYKEIFVKQLRDYLAENFEIFYALTERSPEEMIADLIALIESNIRPKDGQKIKVKKSQNQIKKKESQRLDHNFHEAAKKLQSERNKELRAKIKAENKERSDQVAKKSLKDDPNYIKAREQKRAQDKELRDRLKKERPKATVKISLKENEFYQKAKEARKQQEREYRKLQKERQKERSQSDQP